MNAATRGYERPISAARGGPEIAGLAWYSYAPHVAVRRTSFGGVGAVHGVSLWWWWRLNELDGANTSARERGCGALRRYATAQRTAQRRATGREGRGVCGGPFCVSRVWLARRPHVRTSLGGCRVGGKTENSFHSSGKRMLPVRTPLSLLKKHKIVT